MSARKPLEPDCDGGIFCLVPGHLTATPRGRGVTCYGHIPLTAGQNKTLRERRRLAEALTTPTKEQ